MPNNFLNWKDQLAANQGSAQKMAADVYGQEQKANEAYGNAYGQYKSQATGDYAQGASAPGAAATASYGDAAAKLKAAKDTQALAGTNEGRQALLSHNGQRANWMDAALAGSGYTGAQKSQEGAWADLQNQFGGQQEQAQFQGAQAEYAHKQAREADAQAQRQKSIDARNKQRQIDAEYADALAEFQANDLENPSTKYANYSMPADVWKKYQDYYGDKPIANQWDAFNRHPGFNITEEATRGGRSDVASQVDWMKQQQKERREKAAQRYAAALKAYKESGGKDYHTTPVRKTQTVAEYNATNGKPFASGYY